VKDSFTGADGSITFAVPEGRYPAGKTVTAQDSDLVAANIKGGITILGVLGTYLLIPIIEVVDRDRSDAIVNTLTVGITDHA
jgi:hypothetical protein